MRRISAWRKFTDIWPLIPAAIYLVGFLIIVLVYLIGLSVSIPTDTDQTVLSLKPLSAVFARPQFYEALLNTLIFMLVGTPLELIVGLFFALILYKNFFSRGFLKGFLILPLAIPTLVTATLLFILFDFPGGHINHLLLGKYHFFPQLIGEPIQWRATKFAALGISLIGKVWRDTPISMLILLAGLNSIDPEILDAAKSMGAGIRQRIFRIIVPLLIPSISSVLLLRSIEMWKEFIFPFILAGRYNLLGTLIESLYSWGETREAAAVALVLVVCVGTATLLLLKLLEVVRLKFMRA